MALRDVGQLVGEDRGQLVAQRGHRDQPEVQADVAAGQRKGVDRAVAHGEDLPGEGRVGVGADVTARARGRQQRRPQRLQVVEQQRVVEVGRVAADLAHDLLADAALAGHRQRLGRGVAERGQARRGRGLRERGRGQRRAADEQGAGGEGDEGPGQVAAQRHGYRRRAGGGGPRTQS